MAHYSFTFPHMGGSLYLVLCVLAAIWAANRGRSGVLWFFISLVISPLFAGIFILVLKDLDPSQMDSEISDATHRRCPECREFILKDAKKCKHCGSQVLPQM